jgi:hypothetical protein
MESIKQPPVVQQRLKVLMMVENKINSCEDQPKIVMRTARTTTKMARTRRFVNKRERSYRKRMSSLYNTWRR